MIYEKRIRDFEAMEFGMFVHFGLYSVIGRGEWALDRCDIPTDEYEALTKKFNPDPDWARELAKTAREAGAKYITITTRHHDGFSLFDTKGLNSYDAPHALCGRDLIREFVDACREEGIVPFFYHTLLDWREKSYNENFPEYLKYLRRSVEILCTEYGRIGGLWFDGFWNKPDADWEFDELYGLIRRNQPDAIIVNNTGLSSRGVVGHPEIDSVTYERGRPSERGENGGKHVASEMCQIFGDHWGYARLDFNFKSMAQIIGDYATCKRFGANLLLNVGPMGNGRLRPLDTAMLKTLGDWIDEFSEAVRGTHASDIKVFGRDSDFLLEGNGAYYLFCPGLNQRGDANVTINENADLTSPHFKLPGKVKSARWLDTGADAELCESEDGEIEVKLDYQPYGQSVVIRIAKIEIE